MTESADQINDHLKQQAHAERIREQDKVRKFQSDFMKQSPQKSAAQALSFAVALSKEVGGLRQQVQDLPKTAQPKDTSHKGLDGGVVRLTACVEVSDGVFETRVVLVQGTMASA